MFVKRLSVRRGIAPDFRCLEGRNIQGAEKTGQGRVFLGNAVDEIARLLLT